MEGLTNVVRSFYILLRKIYRKKIAILEKNDMMDMISASENAGEETRDKGEEHVRVKTKRNRSGIADSA